MQQQLGRRLSLHRGLFRSGGWLWYLGAILIAAFAANLANGDVQLALASLGGGILFLIVPVYRWRQSLAVFEQGFVWTRLIGTKVVRKDEVAGANLITHVSRQGQSIEIVILLKDGHQLSATGLGDPDQLFNTLNAWGGGQGGSGVADANAPQSGGASAAEGGWTPPSERGAQ